MRATLISRQKIAPSVVLKIFIAHVFQLCRLHPRINTSNRGEIDLSEWCAFFTDAESDLKLLDLEVSAEDLAKAREEAKAQGREDSFASNSSPSGFTCE